MNPILYILNTTLPYFLFFSSFMPLRPKLTKGKLITAFLITYILRQVITLGARQIFPGNMSAITFANGAGSICLLFLISAFFIGKWYVKGFLAIVFQLFIITIEVIVTLFFIMNYGIDFIGTSMLDLSGIIPVIAQTIIHISMVLLKIFRSRKKYEGSRNAFLIQMVIPIISLVYLSYLINIIVPNGYITTADNVNVGVLILINLSLYFVFQYMENVHHKNREYQIAQRRERMRENYYREVESHQHDIRTMKHDLRNQLISVQGYVDSFQQDAAARQVSTMIGELGSISELDFTRHTGVNTILGFQYLQARREGILCQFQVQVPEEMNFAVQDLSSFLGNLLDNAREACLRHNGTRYVSLVLVYYNNSLIIQSENSTEGTIKNFTSSKGNLGEHGFGLDSMQAVVEKYTGEMQYKAESGRFCVEATLFEPQTEQ